MKVKKIYVFLNNYKNIYFIYYRLRNIFNFVLLQQRHITAGLIYNGFACMGVGVATFEGVALLPFLLPFLLLQHNQNVDIFSSMHTCKKKKFRFDAKIITKPFLYTGILLCMWPYMLSFTAQTICFFSLLSDATSSRRTPVQWKFCPFSFNFPTNHNMYNNLC